MSSLLDRATQFGSGLARGAGQAASTTWDDLSGLARGAWDVARDAPGAREQFWQTTRAGAQAVADYGAQAIDDPARVWNDARATVGRAYTAGRQFATQADAAQWGEALGGAGFTVGSSLLGAGAAAKGAQLASRGAQAASRARQLARGGLPDAPPTPVAPCPLAVANTKRAMRLREDLGPEHFTETGRLRWPPNDGFASPPQPTTLRPGQVIDRYSTDTGLNDRGSFFAPADTPYGARSLPYDEARMQYTRYRVLKPLEAQGGPAAPAFGEPGGGLQYLTPRSTADLIRQGYLEPLPP